MSIKFNPETGKPMTTPYTMDDFNRRWPKIIFKFDPWTGEPRLLYTALSVPDGETGAECLRSARTHPTPTAPDILTAAAKHMADRAKTYDKPGGTQITGARRRRMPLVLNLSDGLGACNEKREDGQ